jgi:hypothetical protein
MQQLPIPLFWSTWIDLNAKLDTFLAHVPRLPGMYRIRVKGHESFAYIGQTGRDLFKRTRHELARNALRPLDSPPWNDPHTAAPLLWAFRHEDDFEFELSVAPCEVEISVRQCLEDTLLYLHRIEHGHSTLCNHGRGHPLWARASNRARSRPVQRLQEAVEYDSLPVAVGNVDPLSETWLGLTWSRFEMLPSRVPSKPGVYRIANDKGIVYLGESKMLRERLAFHQRCDRFDNCSVSYSLMEKAKPWHLKERETDLIGSYFLETKTPPVFQYNPSFKIR